MAPGQYRIVDLRPGTYTVTFTLTGLQHGEARRHRVDGFVRREHQRRHEGRRRRRNDHGQRRDADRRRPERAASDDAQQRNADDRSDRAVVGGHGRADSRHRHSGRHQRGHPGHAADDGVRRRRRARERRPHAGGRPEHRRRAQRRRRLDLRRGHLERAGSRDDDVGRPGRSRSRRPDAQHRAEERRQHRQGPGVSVGRQQRHGRQQLQRRAQGRRPEHAGRAAPAVGLHGRRRRADQEGSPLVLRHAARRRPAPVDSGHLPEPERRRPDEVHLRAGHHAVRPRAPRASSSPASA